MVDAIVNACGDAHAHAHTHAHAHDSAMSDLGKGKGDVDVDVPLVRNKDIVRSVSLPHISFRSADPALSFLGFIEPFKAWLRQER
jgi:hypothetical protein